MTLAFVPAAIGHFQATLVAEKGTHVPVQAYLIVASLLFSMGAFGLLIRRNVLIMFMCIELMLNAVNLTFVAFAKELDDINGQAITFFTLIVAAAETVVGLGIIVSIFRRRREGATADTASLLRG